MFPSLLPRATRVGQRAGQVSVTKHYGRAERPPTWAAFSVPTARRFDPRRPRRPVRPPQQYVLVIIAEDDGT